MGSSRCCRLEVDFTFSHFLLPVIPAEAGIQLSSSVFWISVFTGMTIPTLVVQMLLVGLASILEKDIQRIGRPFRKFSFASRRGISTIPEGDIKKTDENDGMDEVCPR
jgi:hypothetical protein